MSNPLATLREVRRELLEMRTALLLVERQLTLVERALTDDALATAPVRDGARRELRLDLPGAAG
jgi:hypothetical protein